jgi:hypothetical protein
MKYLLAILRNENEEDHQGWIKACMAARQKVDYVIVDLTRNDWLQNIRQCKADYFLTRPPGLTAPFKQLYDERLYVINQILNLSIYPTYEELIIYENKRLLSYWLEANKIPHPETNIFYFEDEARVFIKNASYPLVAKVNIGASGSGVKIINSVLEAEEYIEQVFYGRGAPKRWGPNFEQGELIKRGLNYIIHPQEIKTKIRIYLKKKADIQKDFVILQSYIPHTFEWRGVRIGDSYFAHKKIVKEKKASGSLIKAYENPPTSLLDFLRTVTDLRGFISQAVDMFEVSKDKYLINEMQCFFGQSDPYQMLVDGKPGRYIFKDKTWIIEEGDFNTNESYDLRLSHVLNILENKYNK